MGAELSTEAEPAEADACQLFLALPDAEKAERLSRLFDRDAPAPAHALEEEALASLVDSLQELLAREPAVQRARDRLCDSTRATGDWMSEDEFFSRLFAEPGAAAVESDGRSAAAAQDGTDGVLAPADAGPSAVEVAPAARGPGALTMWTTLAIADKFALAVLFVAMCDEGAEPQLEASARLALQALALQAEGDCVGEQPWMWDTVARAVFDAHSSLSRSDRQTCFRRYYAMLDGERPRWMLCSALEASMRERFEAATADVVAEPAALPAYAVAKPQMGGSAAALAEQLAERLRGLPEDSDRESRLRASLLGILRTL